jgi:hypothetical protein
MAFNTKIAATKELEAIERRLSQLDREPDF